MEARLPPQKPNKASVITAWIVVNIPAIADWMLSMVARLMVLCLGIFAFYCGIAVVLATGDPSSSRIWKILCLVNDNWKALLLLGFPIFYQAVKGLLGRAEVDQLWPPRVVVRKPTAKEGTPSGPAPPLGHQPSEEGDSQ